MGHNPPFDECGEGVLIPDELQAAMTFALTMPMYPNPDVRVEVAATGEITFQAQEDLENYIKIRRTAAGRLFGRTLDAMERHLSRQEDNAPPA